jgi:hypothetical protein
MSETVLFGSYFFIINYQLTTIPDIRLETSCVRATLIAVMEIALRFHNEDKTQDLFSNVHIKLMSSWGNCITTATIAEESTSWEFEEKEEIEENQGDDGNEDTKDGSDNEEQTPRLQDNSQVATWNKSCEKIDFEDKETLEKFNSSPGLYAFLFGYDSEGQTRVLTFAFVDCSGLLMEQGAVSVRSFHRFGMFIDMKVHCDEPLVSVETLMPLEPLVLNLSR